MIRLQRCLKGPAWEAVRSRLILPASVPHVMEALRMHYGRAELLVESLIDKVKATSSPRADKLETPIDFGTKVQALCDHMEAANLNEHLANPALLKDLVGKLPAEYKMRWAAYRRESSFSNLRTFGTFMDEVVTDAYSVTSYAEESGRYSINRQRTKQDRSFMHSDTGGRSDEPKEQEETQDSTLYVPRNLECAVCQKEGHRARDCRSFQKLSIDDRWKRIQHLGLCRTCLYAHGHRICRNKTRCGIDGCDARHHTLLHQVRSAASSGPTTIVHHAHQSSLSSLLYRIIPITLHNGSLSIKAFAFIDEGSSLTMVETDLAKKLELEGQTQPLCLKWTANVTRVENDSKRVSN